VTTVAMRNSFHGLFTSFIVVQSSNFLLNRYEYTAIHCLTKINNFTLNIQMMDIRLQRAEKMLFNQGT
ncbi:MAG: hypothetical protein WBP88_11495, partial [Nitrososphaeraceae archaeon]